LSARFDVRDTSLAGVKVLERTIMGDSRGFLERLFCAEELSALIHNRAIAQVNRTLTIRRGTVRGLHFQNPPHAEIKLVSCLRGEVFDVVVDLRRGSSTFLCWHAELLAADNRKTILIPEGFAHGFQALADGSELLYLHTASYQPAAEGAVNVRDPRVAIRWPEAITAISSRDESHPMLASDYSGLAL
jgi:dTDP-4-dehydrorhamnose 3,5-epimerase